MSETRITAADYSRLPPDWESVSTIEYTWRLRVPGGWLYRHRHGRTESETVIFVPDPSVPAEPLLNFAARESLGKAVGFLPELALRLLRKL